MADLLTLSTLASPKPLGTSLGPFGLKPCHTVVTDAQPVKMQRATELHTVTESG